MAEQQRVRVARRVERHGAQRRGQACSDAELVEAQRQRRARAGGSCTCATLSSGTKKVRRPVVRLVVAGRRSRRAAGRSAAWRSGSWRTAASASRTAALRHLVDPRTRARAAGAWQLRSGVGALPAGIPFQRVDDGSDFDHAVLVVPARSVGSGAVHAPRRGLIANEGIRQCGD